MPRNAKLVQGASLKSCRTIAKVISIDRRYPGGTIRQADLEEMILLRRELREARTRHHDKRNWIREALRSGAMVEDGIHTARMRKRFYSGEEEEWLEIN